MPPDPPQKVDLSNVIPPAWVGQVTAHSPEDPAERDHRQKQEAADAKLRRYKDGFRFSLSAILFVAISGIAAFLALVRSADEALWGRSTLLALGTAVGGYFMGSKPSKDKD